MNVFVQLAQSIAKFFQSDLFKFIIKTGEDILKRVLGDIGSKVQSIALEEVTKAENTPGLTGTDKYNLAYKNIRDRISDPTIAESAVNLAIELAVTAIQNAKK